MTCQWRAWHLQMRGMSWGSDVQRLLILMIDMPFGTLLRERQ